MQKISFLKLVFFVGYVYEIFSFSGKILWGGDLFGWVLQVVKKVFLSENFVFWEKYKKFYIYVEKSFLGRISLVGCLRLVHFRLLLPHLPRAYSWECCRHETMNFT